jgi:fructose-1,6-bisphosphatase/inositol monophosphatase family enzyme
VQADELLDVFRRAFASQRAALAAVKGAARRARTDRPGQYALDLVADAAVLPVLLETGARVVSEESGISGATDAPFTIVVDPVDGSTNCAREIPYWSISVCAVDQEGPWCAFVANGATGSEFAAVRGRGAFVDGEPMTPSTVTDVERSVVAVSGLPRRLLPWKQFRALGSSALSLCEIAAGRLDGFVDALPEQHAPWDYLGGLLMCQEAGAIVVDAHGRSLVTTDPSARRQLLAAATPELLDSLRSTVAP